MGEIVFSNGGYGRTTQNVNCEQVPTADLQAFSYSTANCWHAAGFILSSSPSKAFTLMVRMDPIGAANHGILVQG